ncbi:MAG TPA: DUF72 domain-containing protein [Gemmatimonadaceae bacterium]|nr:DUF72 domain-containing protein [Gemmatimonadaceae bacterium]
MLSLLQGLAKVLPDLHMSQIHAMPDRIRLGCMGWNYDAWVGPFFPSGTRATDFLSVYSRAFDTVEVDATFYAVPPAKTVRGWADRVPPDFVFALKLPQEITHERRFRQATEVLAAFSDSARELGRALGPILIQLGPDFAPNELPALAAFFRHLPRDLRFAIEFRQRGWIHDGVLALLADHSVALALTDGRWIPRKTMLALAERPTADFAYIRWLGPNRDLVDYSRIQIDRTREIEAWVGAIRQLATKTQAIYGYVNNHFSGHAPETTREFQRRLGLRAVEPAQMGEQLSLL